MTAVPFKRQAAGFSVSSALKSPPGKAQFLSVITPVYNEEQNIELLIDHLFEVLPTIGKPFEVIAMSAPTHRLSDYPAAAIPPVRHDIAAAATAHTRAKCRDICVSAKSPSTVYSLK
jgi:hypothetical protein